MSRDEWPVRHAELCEHNKLRGCGALYQIRYCRANLANCLTTDVAPGIFR